MRATRRQADKPTRGVPRDSGKSRRPRPRGHPTRWCRPCRRGWPAGRGSAPASRARAPRVGRPVGAPAPRRGRPRERRAGVSRSRRRGPDPFYSSSAAWDCIAASGPRAWARGARRLGLGQHLAAGGGVGGGLRLPRPEQRLLHQQRLQRRADLGLVRPRRASHGRRRAPSSERLPQSRGVLADRARHPLTPASPAGAATPAPCRASGTPRPTATARRPGTP